MATRTETRVITNLVRFSYANVFEARAMKQGQDPKYSVAVLIPKKDKETLNLIKQACEVAADKKFGSKKSGRLKMPLRDGDEEKPDDDAYVGCYFLNATSKTRPTIVDEGLSPIMSQDDFYSGCYGRIAINFFGYDVDGGKGVGCGIGNIQKLKDGDKLSGGQSAAADFGGGEDDFFGGSTRRQTTVDDDLPF